MVRSKEQEIEILKKWQAEAGQEPGSYLERLMTTDLVAWVKQQIGFDHAPDIIAELAHAEQLERDTYNELQDLKRSNEYIRTSLEQSRGANAALHEELKAINQKCIRLEEKVYDYDTIVDDLRVKLMLAQTEVNRLKARLWDMHESKSAVDNITNP